MSEPFVSTVEHSHLIRSAAGWARLAADSFDDGSDAESHLQYDRLDLEVDDLLFVVAEFGKYFIGVLTVSWCAPQ
ncbi:hypothetical protein MPRS_18240 [Mycobacterium paraseoulense]|nr:hypothetical protein MPRS_18240 [Mycobacterium paraseoulense]